MKIKLTFIWFVVLVSLCTPSCAAIIEEDWAREMLDGKSLPAIDSVYDVLLSDDDPYPAQGNPISAPHDCCLINDPEERHEAGYVTIIRKGTPLIPLAEYGEYLYVESSMDGASIRGFIPPEDYSFAEWKGEFAQAGYYVGRDVDLKELYKKQYAEYKRDSVASGYGYTVGVRSDGTCVAKGKRDQGQCDIYDWENIIAVSASYDHTVGLRADGTVVATGRNDYGQCNVQHWGGIVAISAGRNHTAGLTAEGAVVIAGDNTMFQHSLDAWRNESIVEISSGDYFTVGLTSRGRVLNAGWTYSDAYKYFMPWDESINIHNIDLDYHLQSSEWRDIVSISAGADHVIGLKADGTVVGGGESCNGEQDSLSDWPDVAVIAAGLMGSYGVAQDGSYLDADYPYSSEEWTGTLFMDASATIVAGVRLDGTVISSPAEYSSFWDDVPCYDLSDWNDIGLSSDSEVFVDFIDEDTIRYMNGV